MGRVGRSVGPTLRPSFILYAINGAVQSIQFGDTMRICYDARDTRNRCSLESIVGFVCYWPKVRSFVSFRFCNFRYFHIVIFLRQNCTYLC